MFGSTEVVGILGMRGSGKTHLSRKIQSVYPRVIVLDVLAEYKNEEENTARTFEEFAQKLIASKDKNTFRIIVQFDFANADAEELAEETIRLAYARGSVLLVLEEVQYHASVHHMPRSLKRALLTGRHRDLAIVATSQRPGEVHKTLISQCSKLYLGRMYEYNDIRYLASILGPEAKSLMELPERDFIEFIPGKRKRVVNNDLTERDSQFTVKENPLPTDEEPKSTEIKGDSSEKIHSGHG